MSVAEDDALKELVSYRKRAEAAELILKQAELRHAAEVAHLHKRIESLVKENEMRRVLLDKLVLGDAEAQRAAAQTDPDGGWEDWEAGDPQDEGEQKGDVPVDEPGTADGVPSAVETGGGEVEGHGEEEQEAAEDPEEAKIQQALAFEKHLALMRDADRVASELEDEEKSIAQCSRILDVDPASHDLPEGAPLIRVSMRESNPHRPRELTKVAELARSNASHTSIPPGAGLNISGLRRLPKVRSKGDIEDDAVLRLCDRAQQKEEFAASVIRVALDPSFNPADFAEPVEPVAKRTSATTSYPSSPNSVACHACGSDVMPWVPRCSCCNVVLKRGLGARAGNSDPSPSSCPYASNKEEKEKLIRQADETLAGFDLLTPLAHRLQPAAKPASSVVKHFKPKTQLSAKGAGGAMTL